MTRLAKETVASLRALLCGRVQGVNFRSFVYQRARDLRLTGYVRNLEDGRTLEVVAKGNRANLERLLAYLREGPRGSRVDSIEVEWQVASGEHAGFAVLE